MLEKRLTEQQNPRSKRIDLLSPLEITDLINAEDRMVAQAVGEERESIVPRSEPCPILARAGLLWWHKKGAGRQD